MARAPPTRRSVHRAAARVVRALLLALAPAAATLFGADLGEVTWSAGEAALPFTDLVKHCSPFAARRWAPASRTWAWERDSAVLWSTAAASPSLGPGLPLRLVGGGAGLAAVCTIGAPASADDPAAPPAYLAGDYVLLFDGVGSVTVTGDADGTQAAPHRSPAVRSASLARPPSPPPASPATSTAYGPAAATRTVATRDPSGCASTPVSAAPPPATDTRPRACEGTYTSVSAPTPPPPAAVALATRKKDASEAL